MSGWALQRTPSWDGSIPVGFYALDVGLGFATTRTSKTLQPAGFYALDVGLGFATTRTSKTLQPAGFYALDVGLGFATGQALTTRLAKTSVCFYALDVGLGFATYAFVSQIWPHHRFYALDVGLGFATALLLQPPPLRHSVSMPSMSGWALQPTRICTRSSPPRFYALDVGLGFATIFVEHLYIVTVSMPSMSGWALQHRGVARLTLIRPVSMPSMSGWALQRMPSEGMADLRVCRPPRHPRRNGQCWQAVSG